jgi:hypothetical protein
LTLRGSGKIVFGNLRKWLFRVGLMVTVQFLMWLVHGDSFFDFNWNFLFGFSPTTSMRLFHDSLLALGSVKFQLQTTFERHPIHINLQIDSDSIANLVCVEEKLFTFWHRHRQATHDPPATR